MTEQEMWNRWIQEATEFGNKYNVIIRLKGSIDRCGNKVLTIEMTHQDDLKNTARYKKLGGAQLHPCDSYSCYFETLYEKLPIVRRNRRINNEIRR